jgi:hypothetical protein
LDLSQEAFDQVVNNSAAEESVADSSVEEQFVVRVGPEVVVVPDSVRSYRVLEEVSRKDRVCDTHVEESPEHDNL